MRFSISLSQEYFNNLWTHNPPPLSSLLWSISIRYLLSKWYHFSIEITYKDFSGYSSINLSGIYIFSESAHEILFKTQNFRQILRSTNFFIVKIAMHSIVSLIRIATVNPIRDQTRSNSVSQLSTVWPTPSNNIFYAGPLNDESRVLFTHNV